MARNQKQQGEISKGKRMLNSLWIVLAVVSFTMFIGTAFGHMSELGMVQWGNSIVADYYEEGAFAYAEYTDPEGVVHKYNLTGHTPILDGDKVTLYYTNSLDDVTPRNTFFSYIIYYLVLGGLFAVSMWRIRRMTEPVQK